MCLGWFEGIVLSSGYTSTLSALPSTFTDVQVLFFCLCGCEPLMPQAGLNLLSSHKKAHMVVAVHGFTMHRRFILPPSVCAAAHAAGAAALPYRG